VKWKDKISLSPLRITLIYLVMAGLWIFLSDRILDFFTSDPELLTTLQTYKGLFYVTLTSIGLFYLIKKQRDQDKVRELERENLLDNLRSEKELKDILFERIPVMITIYDPNLNEFDVNKEFEKVIGWSNKEIEKNNIDLLEACYPDFSTREEIIEFMQNPGIGWKEFPMVTKSGETIPTSWTNVRLTDNTSVGIGIDMTDIKASQAKIRESQKLLKKTFESLEESVILVDPQNRTIVDCNKGTQKIFGYEPNELIGRSTKVLHVDQDHFEEWDKMGKESLEESGVFQTEFRMQKKDGTIFYSGHTVTLVYDEDGNVDKVVSVVRDITDQKEYEKKLRKQRERLLRAQKIGQLGDWEFDVESEEIFWSPMHYKIFERDPDLSPPKYGKTAKNYFGKDADLYRDAVQEAIKNGTPYDLDLHLNTEKGNIKYIRAIGIPIKDDSGKVKKLLGVVQDITQRKEAEMALRSNKQRLEAITNNVPGVVFQYKLHPDGTDELNYVSQGAKEVWGISPEALQGNNNLVWNNINIHDEDLKEVQQSIKESAQSLSGWNKEWRYIMPDGEVRWHNGIGIPHEQDDGTIVWDSIIIDITDKKQIQEKIVKSVLEGEDRERKRIAHELHDGLGQYLVAASMNFQSVKQDVGRLPEKRQKQFDTGMSHLKKALSETRSIAHNLMPKSITDYGLIIAIKNLLQDLRDSTDINVTFECNCEDLELTNQTEVNIYRILQESISNAVRHSECSNVSIGLNKNNNTLHLTIEDDGIGMNLEEKSPEKGLGLKSIDTRVQNLNGRWDIESEPGKGTKTHIKIPNINIFKEETKNG